MIKFITLIFLLFFGIELSSQTWELKLTSNVYLRKWKLTSKADKDETQIGGASIILYKAGKQVAQTTSSSDGEFTIMVPPNGDYYLAVSYPGCNTKRMAVNTQAVPDNIANDNFKPSFKISGGFIMVKPYPGINYSELSQDLIRVEYLSSKKAFDDTDEGTQKGLGIVSKIYSDEDALFKNFCSTNKAGDVALAKPDCPLAKTLYEKAITMISGEQYPIDQLAKVGLCLKDKELADKKAIDAKKAEDEKAIADKANKEKAAADKAEADKLVKEKIIADKLAKEKLAAEKIEAEKIAKQKVKEEKVVNTPIKAEVKVEVKVNEKSEKQKQNEEKALKQKEGLANAKAEDLAEEKAIEEKRLAQKVEKDKLAKEKEQKQKEGMAKAKDEELAEEKAIEEKRLAKEKEKNEKAKNEKEALAKIKAEELAEDIAKQKKREADETEKKRLAYENKKNDIEPETGNGDSKYKIPQKLGVNLYKEYIIKGDEQFKFKQYKDAKGYYQEALKQKANDPIAIKKIEECDKLLNSK